MFLCLIQYSSCACSLFWEVRSPAKAVTFCQQLQWRPWGKCFQTAPAMAACTCFHSSSPQTEVHMFSYFNAIIKSSSRAACRACMLDRDTEHAGGMLIVLPPPCFICPCGLVLCAHPCAVLAIPPTTGGDISEQGAFCTHPHICSVLVV